MSSGTKRKPSGTCQTICWAMGLMAGGYLAYVLAFDFGQDIIQSAVLGIVAVLVVGLLFRRLLCRGGSNELRQRMDEVSTQTVKSQKRAERVAEHAEARKIAPIPEPEEVTPVAEATLEPAIAVELAPIETPKAEDDDEDYLDVIPTAPESLSEPDGGAADNLKLINGINRKTEKLLNQAGVFHFQQIADATPNEIAWMDQNLPNAEGLASKRNWDRQAGILATGEDTRYSARVKAQAAEKENVEEV